MTTTLTAAPADEPRRAFASGRIASGRIRMVVIPKQESPKPPPAGTSARRRFITQRGW
ncbi:hypothetical protein [Streptomyces scopuliridis]|uniref:hypothetical protein n=1 Tax=Streptomyces scopuliridis TaxID=452529 RepID=UPI00367ABE2E